MLVALASAEAVHAQDSSATLACATAPADLARLADDGWTAFRQSRLDEAEKDLRAAIRISDELGERQMQSWVWRALARVSELRGDEAEAERRYRRSREAEKQAPR